MEQRSVWMAGPADMEPRTGEIKVINLHSPQASCSPGSGQDSLSTLSKALYSWNPSANKSCLSMPPGPASHSRKCRKCRVWSHYPRAPSAYMVIVYILMKKGLQQLPLLSKICLNSGAH